jgi:signal transduction histidine kinase
MSVDSQKKLEDLRATLLRLGASLSPDEASQIQEQLDELSLDLQQERGERQQFVSHVGHELRVPMTSILGYTDLLRKGIFGPVNEQQLNFLNIIRSNVERMAALVTDLSDLSRLNNGSLALEFESFGLLDVVESVARNLQPAFSEKSQNLEIALPAGSPQVYADPKRLGQVLTRLLDNANRYTAVGGSIHVNIVCNGRTTRLEVKDSGIGISPEDQSRLFEPFFRSDHPTVRAGPGWGLSLSVSKGLVEQMGGEIGAASMLGEGSTFWFTVPVIGE